MYSSNTSSLLGRYKIEIGDTIRVEKDGQVHVGILMPRSEDGDELVIKLESGYNIGVNPEGATVSLVEKAPKAPAPPTSAQQRPRGDIAILGCGGTILSKVEYKTGAAFPTSDPEDIINAFPKMREITSLHARVLFRILSEDMVCEHWKIMAKETADEINSGAKGVVLMHGTDVLHYSAAALSFALQNLPVPVVFVGAQRSSDRPSSDNEANMLNAAMLAKSDIAHVGICMHANSSDDFGYFHLGTKARKMHTSRRDAFQSINSKPLAKVDYKNAKVEPLLPYTKRDESRKLELHNHFSDNVGMLYVHPGVKPELVDKFSDYDGLVVVGTGIGHAPSNPFGDPHAKPMLKNLRALYDSGVSLAFASQTIYGRVDMNIYSAGRLLQETGIIGNGADWTPETAFVKLSWVLGKEKDQKKVAELMMKNIAGELTERTPYEEKFIDF